MTVSSSDHDAIFSQLAATADAANAAAMFDTLATSLKARGRWHALFDLRLLEASNDLYAGSFTSFRKITLPLTMPGIISGTLLTFIPAAGDYVNASANFLGSTSTTMIGNVIESNFLVLQNYPHAASMSLILMSAILILVSAYVFKSGTDDLL